MTIVMRESIHLSLWRHELQNFEPGAPDSAFGEEFQDSSRPAALVMEQVAHDYLLYPSSNPGKPLIFPSQEAAIFYAAKHFVSCEIDLLITA